MKKKIFVMFMVLLFTTAPAGCAQNQRQAGTRGVNGKNPENISIVSTIFPAYDFARAVTGNKADLTMLIKPGAEVHSFDPSPADMIKISNADIFIYNGGEQDVWVGTLLDSIDKSDIRIIKLMDTVTMLEEEIVEGMEEEEEEGEETAYDEHIWTSPGNAVLMINAIRDELCEIDGKNTDIYTKNAEAYTLQIQRLDDEIKEIVENAERNLLVFGDRFPFRYLVNEFGLRYRAAFPGCSAETEASAGTLAYLVDTIKNDHIPYIYYIELSNKNVAVALSEQTGAEMLLLHSCQNVTRDEFEAGETYLSLMRQNAENLRKGLAGS